MFTKATCRNKTVTLWTALQCMTHQADIHSEPLKTWQFIFDYNFG